MTKEEIIEYIDCLFNTKESACDECEYLYRDGPILRCYRTKQILTLSVRNRKTKENCPHYEVPLPF